MKKCRHYEKKVCLYYHIGQCLGYCEKFVEQDVLDKMKQEIISFLNGNHTIVTDKLRELMEVASEKLQFEKALEYKELLDYINITLEKQKVELDDNLNRDIIGYYAENNYLSMQMLFVIKRKTLNHFPVKTD